MQTIGFLPKFSFVYRHISFFMKAVARHPSQGAQAPWLREAQLFNKKIRDGLDREAKSKLLGLPQLSDRKPLRRLNLGSRIQLAAQLSPAAWL